MDDMIDVENVNHPDSRQRLNRPKYEAMKAALMKVVTDQPPGTKVAELKEALKPHLDAELFPGGATSGWWLKAVHLDLEAKGVLRRADRPPVRLYRVTDADDG